MLAEKLNSAGGAAASYVDDVFSTYLYTGNNGTQTITNGIDLAGKGGMVWSKARSGAYSHSLWDSASGTSGYLKSDATSAKTTLAGTTFNNNGFTFSGIDSVNNSNSILYSSWTFRKAPKFFDVVTWTGDNTTRAIQHSLGITPGMIIVKRTDITSTQGWITWHTSTGGTNNLLLNSTAPATALVNGRISAATSTNFTVTAGFTNNADVNASGGTYIAYVFAHDSSADGIIQCGSFTTDASGNATVNLGWEPQYFLVKAAGIAQNWFVVDAVRGMSHTSNSTLYPNLSNAEALATNNGYVPTATGLQINGALSAVQSYIYLAIRRSNKPPTSSTQVFQPVAYTGNGSANRLVDTAILTDAVFARNRNLSGTGVEGFVVGSRLTGNAWMKTALTQNEISGNGLETPTASYGNSFSAMNGYGVNGPAGTTASTVYSNLNINWWSDIAYAFKRAKGFMDVVCYTGAGVPRWVSHNLTTPPSLILIKNRANADWRIFFDQSPAGGIDNYLTLNASTGSTYSNGYWGNFPTNSQFRINASELYINGNSYIAYLFATLPGISKLYTYIGNGSSRTIDCGFSSGARFVLIKRTDNTGDWYVWDTARGIIAGNDPHLSLNTSAAEVTTDDSIDPDSSGFIVNQLAATNINVTGASYTYLAIS